MFLQDNDPHHLHPDVNYIYYFLLLATILVALVLFVGWKIMNHLENREKPDQSNKKDSEPVSEKKD